ncbi:tyrosine-type recombinase/integrase [Acetomicrobium sp. S15 = DSM 107314]|uniref:tyrosine-type recombinase/integrase n=1 Tax=Acetomicrobium sp. S15 = DSM 107314 TaxID=2529858 RepID=UPI0018E1BD29|nr:tyrosine-type recombinase/integrase [Acetomicrobium sp. S15 = DSM 107314]
MEYVEPIRNRADVVSVAEYLGRWNPVYYLLFEFGIHTGLRVSDLRRLTFGDIIEEFKSGARRWRKEIWILEQKTRKKGKARTITNRKRIIRIKGTELEYVIKSQLSPISQWDLSEPLFPSRRLGENGETRALGRIRIWEILRMAAEACGIEERVGTHTMRKTFGYHFYRKTRDIAVLQKIFGHSTPEITLRYIGITQDDHAAAYQTVTYRTKKAFPVRAKDTGVFQKPLLTSQKQA